MVINKSLLEKLDIFLNEIISKEDWEKKYSKEFYSSFDKIRYKEIIFKLTDLFKKLNKGKLSKTVIFDYSGKFQSKDLNRNDKIAIKVLTKMGYNCTDYLKGYCIKNNKEKSVYDVLSSLAKTDKLKMYKFYDKNPKSEIKQQLDAIEIMENNNLIVNKKLNVSKLSINNNKNKKIVFTYDHRAIASQSTSVGWRSCMNLDDGGFKEMVGSGASEGVFIAYLVDSGDEFTLEHPTGRVLLKPFQGVISNDLYWIADTTYGTVPNNFIKIVQKIVNKIQGNLPKKEDMYDLSDNIYQDNIEKNFSTFTGISDKIYNQPTHEIFKIKNPTEEQLLIAIAKEPELMKFPIFKSASERVHLKAISIKSNVIGYLDNPTEKEQIMAIKDNMLNLYNIKNPTEKVQLLAIKSNPVNIQYIKNPTEKVQMIVVKDDSENIRLIDNPTEKVKNYVESLKFKTVDDVLKLLSGK